MASAAPPPATGKTRASALEDMMEGETISTSLRLPLDYGVNASEYSKHITRLRGTMDAQVARARRKNPGRTYVVENVAAITSRGDAMIVTVAATRLQ